MRARVEVLFISLACKDLPISRSIKILVHLRVFNAVDSELSDETNSFPSPLVILRSRSSRYEISLKTEEKPVRFVEA